MSITIILGFPGDSVVKSLPASAGDVGGVGSIPGLGRSPGEGNSKPLQYSCLDNPMDREAWGGYSHRVPKNQTRLSMHARTHHNFRVFSLSWKETPTLLKHQSPSPTMLCPTCHCSKPLETTNLLSTETCLLGAFYRNGFIQYVAFCVWFLSLSMFSGFIHIAVLRFFLLINIIALYGCNTFCLSSWRLILPFGYYK